MPGVSHKHSLKAALAKGRYSKEFEQAQNDFYDWFAAARERHKHDPAKLKELATEAMEAWSIVPPDKPACLPPPKKRRRK